MYKLLKYKTREDWKSRNADKSTVNSKYFEVLREESIKAVKQGYYRCLILKEDDEDVDNLLSEEVVAVTLENRVCYIYLGDKVNSLLRRFLISIEPSLKFHNEVYKIENIKGKNYITKNLGKAVIKTPLTDEQQGLLSEFLKSKALYNRNMVEEIVFRNSYSFKTIKGYFSVIEEKEGYNLVEISVNMF